MLLLELTRLFLIIQDKNPIQGGSAERKNEGEIGLSLGLSEHVTSYLIGMKKRDGFYITLENV